MAVRQDQHWLSVMGVESLPWQARMWACRSAGKWCTGKHLQRLLCACGCAVSDILAVAIAWCSWLPSWVALPPAPVQRCLLPCLVWHPCSLQVSFQGVFWFIVHEVQHIIFISGCGVTEGSCSRTFNTRLGKSFYSTCEKAICRLDLHATYNLHSFVVCSNMQYCNIP